MEVLIFAEQSPSAKTAKINTLENFPLYGRHFDGCTATLPTNETLGFQEKYISYLQFPIWHSTHMYEYLHSLQCFSKAVGAGTAGTARAVPLFQDNNVMVFIIQTLQHATNTFHAS